MRTVLFASLAIALLGAVLVVAPPAGAAAICVQPSFLCVSMGGYSQGACTVDVYNGMAPARTLLLVCNPTTEMTCTFYYNSGLGVFDNYACVDFGSHNAPMGNTCLIGVSASGGSGWEYFVCS